MLALEQKYGQEVNFIIVDADDAQGQKLAGMFGVNTIPAFFFINDEDKIVSSIVGGKDINEMKKLVELLL